MIGAFTSYILILAAATVTTAGLAAYAWQREEHGTRSFVGLMIVFTMYSGAHAVGLVTFARSTVLDPVCAGVHGIRQIADAAGRRRAVSNSGHYSSVGVDQPVARADVDAQQP